MLRIARQGATVLNRGRFVTNKAASVGAPSAVQPVNEKDLPTITECGQAFSGDLRSTSALGVGDGITSHTEKWMSVRRMWLYEIAKWAWGGYYRAGGERRWAYMLAEARRVKCMTVVYHCIFMNETSKTIFFWLFASAGQRQVPHAVHSGV